MAKKQKVEISKKEVSEDVAVEEGSSSMIKKKFPNLADYKAKVEKEVEYKTQEWIDMSHAFKNSTRLPGIPTGSVVMCYGKSDTGKTTMAVEAAANAQKQGILPIMIITENKFSWERAKTMGLDPDNCVIRNDIQSIEEGIEVIREILNDQESGKLPHDIMFVWDSIGIASDDEKKSNDDGEEASVAMMKTAKVIRAKITRFIGPKINNTRRATYPYTATLFVVNHAYTAPPKPPSRVGSIEPYGGDGLWLAATLVFRMGGIMSRSSKVSATKDGITVSFAIKSALVLEKNHITDVSAKGTIICTDHGFIVDDESVIDEYKKKYKKDWQLNYDEYWKHVSDK